MEINQQINQYLDYCKNIRQMSANTLNNKQSVLRQFVRETKIVTLENLDNNTYNIWLKTRLACSTAPASISIYNSTIFNFIKFHQNAGVKIIFNFNLVPHFKTIKTSRNFYTSLEIKQILKYANETERLMIMIMFETGMRIHELANLKTENFKNTKINFIGKGQKPREVYISTKTWTNIQKYLKKYHIGDGYIWCIVNGAKTLNGKPPTTHTIRKNLRRIFENAGFDGFYPHALRHSFATNLQRKGASLPEIKEMMGHSSIATTERYLHGFDGRLEELFLKYQ